MLVGVGLHVLEIVWCLVVCLLFTINQQQQPDKHSKKPFTLTHNCFHLILDYQALSSLPPTVFSHHTGVNICPFSQGEYFSRTEYMSKYLLGVNILQGWIFYRVEYCTEVNILQGWIFFRCDYFSGVNICSNIWCSDDKPGQWIEIVAAHIW